MIDKLHLGLFALGLVAGAFGAAIGWRWPSRRYLALPAAVGVALDCWMISNPRLGLPALATVLWVSCFVLTRAVGIGRGAVRPLAWLPLLALPVVAFLYLSLPDTEGAVLLGGALLPVALVGRADQWRGPGATTACWVLALVAGITVVIWIGAADRFSFTGWWIAKVVLLVAECVLLALAAREFRSSEPVRPPP